MAREGQGRFLKLLGAALIVLVGGIVLTSLLQRLASLKRQLAETEQTLQSLTDQHEELQHELATIEATRKGLEEQLNVLRNQLASTGGELERLRGTMSELQVRNEVLQDDNIQLERQVSQLTRERDESTDRAHRLEQEKENLQRSASRLRERLALLDRDHQQLASQLAELKQQSSVSYQSGPRPDVTVAASTYPSSPSTLTASPSLGTPHSVELPPIVVRKDQAGTGLPIRGRVVEVNEAHRFVVIDKGGNDGVWVGMTFDVLRSGGTVGQAVAIRVRPQLAACDMIGSRSPGSVQVGDLAVQRGP